MSIDPFNNGITAPTQFIDVPGRRLAYRRIGEGKPILLCTRFRGNLDDWDPAFLDALCECGFQVLTFEYSGLGQSTGDRTYDPYALGKDAADLLEAMCLRDVVVCGWSIGGAAAQVVVARHPQRVSHVVLIGTSPPGVLAKRGEQRFHDKVSLPTNTFEDEIDLFFEPSSAGSRAAARRSADRIAARRDRSVPVDAGWVASVISRTPRPEFFASEEVLEALAQTSLPMLHIGGDHDIVCPVENWYALNRRFPTLQLITYPQAGHAPQHQHPEATAEHIETFVRETS
jgi:pimeloyl-ACP methyl ester carboxylesterase